jgi:hypothetical protein
MEGLSNILTLQMRHSEILPSANFCHLSKATTEGSEMHHEGPSYKTFGGPEGAKNFVFLAAMQHPLITCIVFDVWPISLKMHFRMVCKIAARLHSLVVLVLVQFQGARVCILSF